MKTVIIKEIPDLGEAVYVVVNKDRFSDEIVARVGTLEEVEIIYNGVVKTKYTVNGQWADEIYLTKKEAEKEIKRRASL